MKHRATPRFWASYRRLPDDVQRLADRCYKLLRRNSRHPSLHCKKVGRHWSVRVGLHHRALAVERDRDLIWYWIGPHDEYDRIIKKTD